MGTPDCVVLRVPRDCRAAATARARNDSYIVRQRRENVSRLFLYCVTTVLVCVSVTAHAQAWPTKPVRYIVPFPAGASPDIIARLLTERLTRIWGQQVLVDNRSGAGGTVGAAFAAK